MAQASRPRALAPPLLPLLVLLLTPLAAAENTRMKEVFAWKQVGFAFPDGEAEAQARAAGEFEPDNNLPLGLDVSGDRLFVTVPRWKGGVAATLNVIHLNNETLSSKAPPLTPYPSWEANRLPDDNATDKSERIISVFRVRADQCKRLWVMDTGVADLLGHPKRHTGPKLLVYDLNTDTLLRSYALPDDHVKDDSFFANVVVDTTKESCDDAHAYLPDLGSNALVVYSWAQNDSWRVQHHFFHFDPLQGDYEIAGVNFQWTDGLFGLALSPPLDDGSRTVYFHPLSSTHEFQVNSRVLQNRTAAGDYHAYKVLGSRGPRSQATASFLHEPTGVMFYTQVNRNGVGCWNTKKPFSEEAQGLVAADDDTLVFPNDLKVCGGNNLWVLSDKLPHFVYRSLDPQAVNFRIFRTPVADAVRGTVCEA